MQWVIVYGGPASAELSWAYFDPRDFAVNSYAACLLGPMSLENAIPARGRSNIESGDQELRRLLLAASSARACEPRRFLRFQVQGKPLGPQCGMRPWESGHV